MTAELLLACCVVDAVLGDPETWPHPVRWIGKTISLGERLLRRPQHQPFFQFLCGMALSCTLVLATWGVVDALIHLSILAGKTASVCVIVWIGASTLAARNLMDESFAVYHALNENNLPKARVQIARIVGRDTETLNRSEIARATIETLAESFCDGIVAPFFWLAIGGPALAMAYKAVNTLDSMIGHRDSDYFWFGKFAARMDDVANYIPARIAFSLIFLATVIWFPAHCRSAWTVWKRDSGKHASPNAGQTESVIAGALQVRLGGRNNYNGEQIDTPFMGVEFSAPDTAAIPGAINLLITASALGCLIACVCLL